MARNLVLGVDAGSATVVAALAEVAEGEPHVVGVGLVPSAGVHRGAVVDIEAAAAAIRQAVATACQMADCPDPVQAVVSVSGAHIRSLTGTATVPVLRPGAGVAPEDVRRALDAASVLVQPEGRAVIHVSPRAYRLDGNGPMREVLGLYGRQLEAESQLVTGDALVVQNHLRAVRTAQLAVLDYQVAVRAAGEAVLTGTEREKGVLLLDLGAGTTGVAVYDRGHLYHVAVLPVGGEHITHDIATVLQVPVATAESLKVERGWADVTLASDEVFALASPSGRKVREVSDKKIAAIIEPRVEEILQLAAAAVKRSGYGGLFPAGLVLTGGGSRLKGIDGVAADCLALPARVGRPAGPLAAAPEMATAVGLARWGAHLVQSELAAAASQQQPRVRSLRDWLRSLFQ